VPLGCPHTWGVATPPPTPTTFHHHVLLTGDSPMMVAWVHARKSPPNRPLMTIYRWERLSHQTHNAREEKKRRATLLFLVFG